MPVLRQRLPLTADAARSHGASTAPKIRAVPDAADPSEPNAADASGHGPPPSVSSSTATAPTLQEFLEPSELTAAELAQRFGNKIYLTHEEKVTSLAANCAAGCLHNQLHIELCLLELLRELSSAWYHYSRRTFDLQHTGSRAA